MANMHTYITIAYIHMLNISNGYWATGQTARHHVVMQEAASETTC